MRRSTIALAVTAAALSLAAASLFRGPSVAAAWSRGDLAEAAFSPSGGRVAAIDRAAGSAEAVVLDARNGRVLSRRAVDRTIYDLVWQPDGRLLAVTDAGLVRWADEGPVEDVPFDEETVQWCKTVRKSSRGVRYTVTADETAVSVKLNATEGRLIRLDPETLRPLGPARIDDCWPVRPKAAGGGEVLGRHGLWLDAGGRVIADLNVNAATPVPGGRSAVTVNAGMVERLGRDGTSVKRVWTASNCLFSVDAAGGRVAAYGFRRTWRRVREVSDVHVLDLATLRVLGSFTDGRPARLGDLSDLRSGNELLQADGSRRVSLSPDGSLLLLFGGSPDERGVECFRVGDIIIGAK